MKKNYFLYVVALLLTYACSSSQPEDCFIPKNAVEFAGNAFSSFSLGADVKLYTVQNPENSSQWTIQAVVPVRKVVSTPIDELSIDLVMLDDRGLRVRDGLVLQAEDMPNLLPVFNAGENMERAIVFSIPDEAKKYLSASDVSQLLNETKGVRMNFNVLTPPEPSPATEVETSVAPEPSPAKVAATPAAPEKKAVEAPKAPAKPEFPMTLDGLCRKHGVYGLLSQYEQALSNRNRSRAKQIEDHLWSIEKRVRADNSISERLRDSFVRYIEDKEDDIEDRY